MLLDLIGWMFGGAEEDRTPDLRIANATLSQLSYGPRRRVKCPPITRTINFQLLASLLRASLLDERPRIDL